MFHQQEKCFLGVKSPGQYSDELYHNNYIFIIMQIVVLLAMSLALRNHGSTG